MMLVTGKNNKWCIDYLDENSGYFFDIQRVIVHRESKYQVIEVLESNAHGICLLLDGKLQSTSSDEFIYHEALVHPPMAFHDGPKDVLIVGGGEGATIREVLKYSTVGRIVVIDVDEEVIKVAKEFLSMMHQGSFDNEKVELVITDGFEYVKSCPENTFDVAILDLSDPIEMGPSYPLFTVEFYRELSKKMRDGGAIVAQGGSTFVHTLKPLGSVVKTLSEVFDTVVPYNVFVPSFAYPWVIVLAFKGKKEAMGSELEKRLKERGIFDSLRFLSGEMFDAMKAFPKYVREGMWEEGEVITLSNPLFVT